MAWEQRGEKRYYYRSVRNGKKVKKVYFGSGAEAAAVAEMMEVSRLARVRRNEKIRTLRQQYQQADAALGELNDAFDPLADAILLAAKNQKRRFTTRNGDRDNDE